MSKFFKVNVSVVIFNNNNQVLIQKRSQDEEVFPGLWGIPGGTVEMTDATLNDALNREVDEEVGVKIENPILIKENVRAKETYGVVYLVFWATYLSGTPTPKDGTECVGWKNFSEIEGLDFTPTTKETIELAYERKNSSNRVLGD